MWCRPPREYKSREAGRQQDPEKEKSRETQRTKIENAGGEMQREKSLREKQVRQETSRENLQSRDL